jgi:hypothetical protein
MMEMGGHVATGLGHGIEDSAHQPGRPCAKWPTPWLAPGPLARPPCRQRPRLARGDRRRRVRARPSAAPITIHIHQQPGEDAQALAERVGRILERKGKGHGAFADDF